MSGTKENDFMLLVLCCNVASSVQAVADGKPWVSCHFYAVKPEQIYTMLTRVTFLAFRLSVNVYC